MQETEKIAEGMKARKVFEGRSLFFWVVTSIVLVGALGIVDYRTGNEFSFSLFYLIPISLTAWYANRPMGIFICILSAVTWLAADKAAGENYTRPIIYFWNTLIRFGFFLIVTYLLSELRKAQKTVQTLARTDYVTEAINSRYFHELLETELSRSSRYKRPFTMVYLDLDNFKQVNDRFGHDEGDRLIKFIADELKRHLRITDTVARLGGDEFGILFPETGQSEAKAVISKVHDHLIEQLRQAYPFVTFSAGAVTYIATPDSTKDAIKIADDLMYSVKKSTKNGILYSLYMAEQNESQIAVKK
jgi:diguanylate cyclase (GGDEF)-like protein